MTNVIVPLVYALLTIGKTIDLRNYDSITDYRIKSIFSNDDVVETQVNDLNSTYYVLPDEKIPYSKAGLPIDFVIRDKPGSSYRNLKDFSYKFLENEFTLATILVVTEYRKIEQSIKENSVPIPGWQSYNRLVKKHTHYVDKMHYGGRCISTITVGSSVFGDVQIFRRILRDVMGESGSVGKDTIGLWKKALKAMQESKEIRGNMYVHNRPMCSHVNFPNKGYRDVETLLKYLIDFPKYVHVRDLHGRLHEDPIYVTLKPLHDLDQRFDSVEKNVLAERYFQKLHTMYSDLEKTKSDLDGLFNKIMSDDEKYEKANVFYRKWFFARKAVGPLTYSDLSIYKDINETKFNAAFETYYKGLDESTENYFMDLKRLDDEIGVDCENELLRPVKGSLFVEKDEFVKKDNADFSECEQLCLSDERCRAVEYSEKDRQCLIHQRSTNSAKILFSQDGSADRNVYDRKCRI